MATNQEAGPPASVAAQTLEVAFPLSLLSSGLWSLAGRHQGDGGLGGEQEERERLLKVQADDLVGVTGIADRNVLADVQIEVAAPGRQYARAVDRGRPDDFVVDEPGDVLE